MNGSNTFLRNVLINLVVALTTGSIVFGFTMASVVPEVKANTIDIGYLKQADSDQKAALIADRADFTARMEAMAGLVSKQTELCTELITVARLQQSQKVN